MNFIWGFLSNKIDDNISIIKSFIKEFFVKSIFIINNDVIIISGIFLIAHSNIVLTSV